VKEIEVIIDKDGNVTVEAVGFKGKACAAATKAIEEALGKVTSSKKKPEFNQQDHVKVGAGK